MWHHKTVIGLQNVHLKLPSCTSGIYLKGGRMELLYLLGCPWLPSVVFLCRKNTLKWWGPSVRHFRKPRFLSLICDHFVLRNNWAGTGITKDPHFWISPHFKNSVHMLWDVYGQEGMFGLHQPGCCQGYHNQAFSSGANKTISLAHFFEKKRCSLTREKFPQNHI